MTDATLPPDAASMNPAGVDEVWGNSGSPYDQREWFSIGDIARAFILDTYKKMVPALPTKLTPEGVAYHAWIDTLWQACRDESDSGLPYYGDDKTPFDECHVSRADLRKWCESRKMRPRFLFPVTGLNLPCLDKEHADYSTELAAAISAWMALYHDGNINRKRGAKSEIEAWLKINYPQLRNEAKSRIATVVNPDATKKGGAPKTK